MDEAKQAPGILVFLDKMEEWTELLTETEIGKLVNALYLYASQGIEAELETKQLKFLLRKAIEMVEYGREHYRDVSASRSYAGKCSSAAKKNEPKPDRETYMKEYRKKQESDDPYGQNHELPSSVVKKKAKEEEVRIREEGEKLEKLRQERIAMLDNYGKSSNP